MTHWHHLISTTSPQNEPKRRLTTHPFLPTITHFNHRPFNVTASCFILPVVLFFNSLLPIWTNWSLFRLITSIFNPPPPVVMHDYSSTYLDPIWITSAVCLCPYFSSFPFFISWGVRPLGDRGTSWANRKWWNERLRGMVRLGSSGLGLRLLVVWNFYFSYSLNLKL